MTDPTLKSHSDRFKTTNVSYMTRHVSPERQTDVESRNRSPDDLAAQDKPYGDIVGRGTSEGKLRAL